MEKIIITGVNGYIASNLVEKLLKENSYQIYGISRSGARFQHEYYHHIQEDLGRTGWTNALPPYPDIIIHLAQSKQHRHFPTGAEDMVRININSTFELLEWSRKNEAKQFILASTGNVYKPNTDFLIETDPCEATSMYAATKLSAEHLVTQYSEYFQTTILRIFGVYGFGQEDRLIPSIIERINNRMKVDLAEGQGLFLTPLYISDCIKMIQGLIMNKKLLHHEIVNLSGNEKTHLGEIVEMIYQYLGLAPNIEVTNTKPLYLLGNNKKICGLIDYKPRISLKDGLRLTINNHQT